MLKIIIDSKYYRRQFDDWLAGGTIEYKGKNYHWSAQDSNYGVGWDIDLILEEDFDNLEDEELIIRTIEKCLYKHQNEYVS